MTVPASTLRAEPDTIIANFQPKVTSLQNDTPALSLQQFTRADDPAAFERAMALRTEVFVEEQQVPVEEELDHYDDEAIHWLLSDSTTGEPVATGRMISYQEVCQARPVAKIGRIAVKKAARGLKLGERIMRAILDYCRADGFDQAILDSQTYIIPFYAKLGFVVEGDEFMDAGIPHYRMRLEF